MEPFSDSNTAKPVKGGEGSTSRCNVPITSGEGSKSPHVELQVSTKVFRELHRSRESIIRLGRSPGPSKGEVCTGKAPQCLEQAQTDKATNTSTSPGNDYIDREEREVKGVRYVSTAGAGDSGFNSPNP